MDVRFLIFFPNQTLEVLFALKHVLSSLRTTFPTAWIGGLIQNNQVWLVNNEERLDQVFGYEKTPTRRLPELRRQLPDYLIDLTGEPKWWLFRNRLKVMDFRFSKKQLNAFRTHDSLPDLYLSYKATCNQLLQVFDLNDSDQAFVWQDETCFEFVTNALPASFVAGYLVLNLEEFSGLDPVQSQNLKENLQALDHPTVLLGGMKNRSWADQLAQNIGCSVFPVCGDFTWQEEQYLVAYAAGMLGSNAEFQHWSFIQNRPRIEQEILQDEPSQSGLNIGELRGKLKKQT